MRIIELLVARLFKLGTLAHVKRYLNLLIVAIFGLLALAGCGSGGDSGGKGSVAIESTSSCQTLRTYAFKGIPATYIDEGTALLTSLAGEFSSLGRSDIAAQINEAISLTYQGSLGQIQAKNKLMEAANSGC